MAADLTLTLDGEPIAVYLGENTTLAGRYRDAAQTSSDEAAVFSATALQASAFMAVRADAVTYDSMDRPHEAASVSLGALGYGVFSGFMDTVASADLEEFNAIRLAYIHQHSSSTENPIYKVRVEVRTLSANAQAADAIAYGELSIAPISAGQQLLSAVIPLRDVGTGDFVDSAALLASLDTETAFVYRAYDSAGEPTAISDVLGVPSGLTHRQAYYIDGSTGLTGTYVANPQLAIEPVLLDNPAVAAGFAASEALRESLGLNTAALASPGAYEPILAPRLYVMQSQQTNVHFADLHSASASAAYDVTCSYGQQFDELWRLNGSADIAAAAFQVDVLDPAELTVLGTAEATLDCVLANAAGGAARRLLCLGDSTTFHAVWLRKLLDNAAANASGVQLTLLGTREAWVVDVTGKACENDVYSSGGNDYTVKFGLDPDEIARACQITLTNAGSLGASGTLTVVSGHSDAGYGASTASLPFTNGKLVKHEGEPGKTVSFWYQPTSAPDIALNPFIDGGTGEKKFDASFYGTDTGQAAPDITFIHLGINDVFAQTTDAGAHAIMDGDLDKLDRIIGLTADAAVGSLKEWNASMKVIVALTIAPAGHQDAFGDNYTSGQNRVRYRRNLAICQYRLKEHFKSREADGVFLLGWNVTLNKDHSFPSTLVNPVQGDPATITRQLNGVHPASHGYNLMGSALWQCLNVLVARSLA